MFWLLVRARQRSLETVIAASLYGQARRMRRLPVASAALQLLPSWVSGQRHRAAQARIWKRFSDRHDADRTGEAS